ncbi:MAG TPA: hypothetical protein PLL69_01840 [Gemmatimonadales bacterium]|nr:hypothetical protein [Gemmatimonadales bacterium]
MNLRQLLLYLAFFLSGAAALAYESAWTRYLGLLVGHDAYAQVLVLVIFLGGMSGGAALTARHTVRIGQPLIWYAVMEAVVGAMALGFHDVFQFTAGFAYDTLFPSLAASPMTGVVKWGLAALLILPQSILLGTTFPLMSAGVIRLWPTRPGRILSWLYFTNSLGGAVGVLLAGFVLLEVAGLPGTLAAAGAINLAVALLVLGVVRIRTTPLPVTAPSDPAQAMPVHASEGGVTPRLLLTVAFGTAVASFAYEIDWIRMLSLVLGSSTHAFELMLSAFILGLAIGALVISRLDSLNAPLRTLGWIQVSMGVLAVLTLPVYVASFDWMAALLRTFARTDAGYAGFSMVRYALCLAVMLPATICAGMTLPLITRALMIQGAGESAIGRVYAWNTLGSIVGVGLAALVLLPGMGLKPMLMLAGSLDVALGLAIFTAMGRTRTAAAAAVSAAVVIGAIAVRIPLEQALVTSGVFRSGNVRRDYAFTIPFYSDGRTATVAVGRYEDGGAWISTNGKTDASIGAWWQESCADSTQRRQIGGDEITQILLSLVTHAYHPAARRAAIVGFGSGMSSHILLSQPALEEVTTVEIEPAMVEGSRLFGSANSRVYEDPRSRIVIRDAKAHFAASPGTWDLILSEPSNPWVSGVAGLFTEEFYHRVAGALSDDGIFGQWLHTYELSDPLVLSVLASIDRVFPNWRLHQVGAGDLLVIASRNGNLPELRAEITLGSIELQKDLCRFVPITSEFIASLVLAESSLLEPVLRSIGQPNSDFYPALDLGAERARFVGASASGTMALGHEWFNLSRALDGDPVRTPAVDTLPTPVIHRTRLSWARHNLGIEGSSDDPVMGPALQSYRLWQAVSNNQTLPGNWRAWLDAHLAAFRVAHGGMAGTVDSSFVGAAEKAARRLGAPDDVLAVLDFRHAVQGWNTREALNAATRLRQAGALLLADELRDGAVVMALLEGNRRLALEWFSYLKRDSTRGEDDLRTLLLEAHISAATDDTATN